MSSLYELERPILPQPRQHGSVLQRRCACGGTPHSTGECAACHARRIARDGSAAPAVAHDALREPGRPLRSNVRNAMERRFGQDLSGVRVVSGSTADAAARSMGAAAYTVGSTIVAGGGRGPSLESETSGLLEHELAHVVQQRHATPATGGPLAILDDPALEQEADAAAGASRTTVSGVARGLQRSPDPQLCSSTWTCSSSADCSAPDTTGTGGESTSWEIIVQIDIEAESAADVGPSTVGHAYVEFRESNGRVYTYGFYPDPGMRRPDPMFRPETAGCVVHPDRIHGPCVDYHERFTVTKAQYEAALAATQGMCRTPPTYNIQTFNCTTFAVSVAQSASHAMPSPRGVLGGTIKVQADNPNTLLEGLRDRDVPTRHLLGDTEIRDWVAAQTPEALAALSLGEKLRMTNRLLDGWVSDDDLTAIRKICRNASATEMTSIRAALHSRELDLTDIGQRTQLRVILAQ
jgi:hypothetical protein